MKDEGLQCVILIDNTMKMSSSLVPNLSLDGFRCDDYPTSRFKFLARWLEPRLRGYEVQKKLVTGHK